MDIHTVCSFCGTPVVRRQQAKSANVKLHFCNKECKANYQKLAKPVTKEWLEEHYLVKSLDCVQIGRMVGRDPKSVWNWLKDFGIPTRARGGNPLPTGSGKDNPFYGKKHTPEFRKKLSEFAKATGRVPYDPAVGSYMIGRKGKDATNWKGGITPERQALYSSLEWIEAVKSVWARADAKCERCGISHNTVERRGTFHIHHIVGFVVRELRTNPDNLALLCSPCHHFVHSSKNVDSEFIKEQGE